MYGAGSSGWARIASSSACVSDALVPAGAAVVSRCPLASFSLMSLSCSRCAVAASANVFVWVVPFAPTRRCKDSARKVRRVHDRLAVEEELANADCGPIPPDVRVERSWRTSNVLAIARRIRAARDVIALPVLADALEEAGCLARGLLAH